MIIEKSDYNVEKKLLNEKQIFWYNRLNEMILFCLGNLFIMFKCIYNVFFFNFLMIYYWVVF